RRIQHLPSLRSRHASLASQEGEVAMAPAAFSISADRLFLFVLFDPFVVPSNFLGCLIQSVRIA
ncbi:MAG: hypothetical protein MUF31_06695, partial [Akkermansiaceae bacterium]|nr:hypothetical protein [Akkermansiaceae bacterium]